MKFTFLYVIG